MVGVSILSVGHTLQSILSRVAPVAMGEKKHLSLQVAQTTLSASQSRMDAIKRRLDAQANEDQRRKPPTWWVRLFGSGE